MKENDDGQDVGQGPDFRRVRTFLCAAFLACAPAGVVSADLSPVSLNSSSDLPLVSEQTEVRAVVRPTDSKAPVLVSELEDSVVPALNAEVEPQYVIAASFSATDMVPGQINRARVDGRESTRGAGSVMVAGEHDEPLKLPYALVLALLAIIGLVPVSRRSR